MLHEVISRFMGPEGVVLRVWECSGTLAGLRTRQLLQRCVEHELDSELFQPASLLRWDVPAAIYACGRMRMPFRSDHNRRFEACGCGGSRVVASMLGWVFFDVPPIRRGLALAHDAMQPELRSCNQSERSLMSNASHAYAHARLWMDRTRTQWHHSNLEPTLSCAHKQWDDMLRNQRAYARAQSLAQQELPRTGGIGPAASLYNQVQLKWRREDIRGVFYTNDTFTARSSGNLNGSKVARALDDALRAAERAFRAAQIVVTHPALEAYHLPIVQYRVTADCVSTRPSARRRAYMEGRSERVGSLREEPHVEAGRMGASRAAGPDKASPSAMEAIAGIFAAPPARSRTNLTTPALSAIDARALDVRLPCGLSLACSCHAQKPPGVPGAFGPNACGNNAGSPRPRPPYEQMIAPGAHAGDTRFGWGGWWNKPLVQAWERRSHDVASGPTHSRAGAAEANGRALPLTARPNHGSPLMCNRELLQWMSTRIAQHAARTGAPLHVLDVGGGDGSVGRQVVNASGDAARVKWRSLDVETPNSSHTSSNTPVAAPGSDPPVEPFDGLQLPAADSSVDVVLFNWVLHHAEANTIGLLQEARRVVRPAGRIVVVEDLRADSHEMRVFQDTVHAGCFDGCAFRSEREWRGLFALLGLYVATERTPPRDCARHYRIPRRLYELAPNRVAADVSEHSEKD